MPSNITDANRVAFRETDEAGNPTATYVFSPRSKTSPARVDKIEPSPSISSWSTKPLISSLSDIFLPSGYPQSDSLQAFCSSIAGLLSSRAVLQGVGVGNANASPTSALLLHILQDISGRLATILFAHRVGTALEPECKTYRLAADVFNDIAMILDCLSPGVPAGPMRVTILSTAGVLRALCGVAGGSSKASLSAHFARSGNLAELNAKDSSQETIISLFGMLVGSVVISHVTNFTTTWLILLTLLALHLSTNYFAVRAVQMTSLNRQRANITFSTLFSSDEHLNSYLTSDQSEATATNTKNPTILTPEQVSKQEHIFHRDGALQWTQPSSSRTHHLGSAQIGVSMSTFLHESSTHFEALVSLFTDEEYILHLSPSTPVSCHKWNAVILLKRGCSVPSQLKAWAHALLAARILSLQDRPAEALPSIQQSLRLLTAGSRFEGYLVGLRGAGWNLDIAALETRGGRRIHS
ncbi:uncharacterized protein N7515_006145 [Penicillium bovifimosum]|uniref:Protein root UVB sensitive/RUS domain-containing protein n=1 Tax=Penicillium bovifimosum TaxID=126998 RepID=A0A9W9GVI2_9EURO|nr:uncharacterized protein N7515_006145 [Penicillium bovifimosum]KAJ5130106.1 hypothetical protein N7515_006145 [Penicillium bovifimosum]